MIRFSARGAIYFWYLIPYRMMHCLGNHVPKPPNIKLNKVNAKMIII